MAVVGGEDFDPVRATLIGAVQEIFPNDPDIRSLSKKDGKYVPGL
jgi:hypothetical protein